MNTIAQTLYQTLATQTERSPEEIATGLLELELKTVKTRLE